MVKNILAIWIVCLSAILPAAAQTDLQPGIIYAIGQKFDRSFNESAFGAMMRFEADYGVGFLEYEPRSVSEFDQAVALMVANGATHIVSVGFYWQEPLAALAADYPDTRFILVDGIVDAPNVLSLTFQEQEGSFLAGVMAAHTSETGELGFIAALDIPLIRRFSEGFEAGARWVDPDISVTFAALGETPAAFNDPVRGKEVGLIQIAEGVDVIFAGAGASNLGIFQAAVEEGVFAIGVDSNQNPLFPGTILTSMVKRVDTAVLGSLEMAWSRAWYPGHRILGLREGGVDIAIDRNNEALVTEAMAADLQRARAAIEAGEINLSP